MPSCCCHPLRDPEFQQDGSNCNFDTCVGEVPIFELCTQEFCDFQVVCSCCFGNGDCTTELSWAVCIDSGGIPACPPGCENGSPFFDCDDWLPIDLPLGACCLPNSGCEVTERWACNQLGGIWFDGVETCDGVQCIDLDGCRNTIEPFYLQGDKAYTKQLCETATMGFAKRSPGLPYHDDLERAQWGYFEPVTTHETRACRVTGANVDPCEQHFGMLTKDDDGYVRPAIYSEPFGEAYFNSGQGFNTKGRWNIGAFVKQEGEDPADRVSAGYFSAWVGVENEPWAEAIIYASLQRCSKIG